MLYYLGARPDVVTVHTSISCSISIAIRAIAHLLWAVCAPASTLTPPELHTSNTTRTSHHARVTRNPETNHHPVSVELQEFQSSTILHPPSHVLARGAGHMVWRCMARTETQNAKPPAHEATATDMAQTWAQTREAMKGNGRRAHV